MPLNPCPLAPVPPETARVARAAFPKGNRYMRMRDALGLIDPHALCGALYPQVGHYGEPPGRLALVPLRPCSEHLTDRQAAEAGRGRMDWKDARGLALTAPGLACSVLRALRTRLLAGAAAERFLTPMRARFSDRGLRTRRGPQRTASTPLVAAVRAWHRLARGGETLQAALHALAHGAPTWRRAQVPAAWGLRSGPACSDAQQPQGTVARVVA